MLELRGIYMGFMGYVFKALGFESNEQKTKPKKTKTNASYKFKNGKTTGRVEHIDGIPVYYPVTFNQAKEYTQFLKDKKAVIISIETTEKAESQRILDYFKGYTLGANAKFIVLDEDRLYLMLPEGLEVEE